MADGWHTYWQNPGDSPACRRRLRGRCRRASPPRHLWPAPHALPAGPLVNYGYEGEVLLLTEIKVAQDARPGDTLTLGAKAEWWCARRRAFRKRRN